MLQIVWKQNYQSEHGTCDKKNVSFSAIFFWMASLSNKNVISEIEASFIRILKLSLFSVFDKELTEIILPWIL